MKKIFNIFFGLVAVAGITSCDDFLTREPINEFSADTYFSSETELKMYTDGMLNSWLPDYTETASGDAYNDLIATKTSTDFFRADVIWDGTKQGGWSSGSWAFLRRCNFMLTKMSNAKGKVSDDIYEHYEGVARFWRAYHYFDMVKTFSNVPWTDKYLQPSDSAILYGPRDDREYVMHQVVEDMKFACEHVMAGKFHTNGRVYIDKYVVLAYASRMFLYEGTFRKNVADNPATGQPWTNQYETADQLIQLAADYAGQIIDDKVFSLHKTYSELFLSNALQTDEVIWGKTFLPDINGRHSYTRYFNSSTLGQQYSGTKELVRMFLKADGTPVLTGEQTINEEFTGRDSRLGATVLGPGHQILINGVYANETINCTFCKTGYMLIKWCIPDATHFQNGIDENSIPIIRYAEVLLNYAEAMNELGKMNETIWNETVGALRERAGVKNIYPGSASYVPDTWLRNYYTKDVNHVPTSLNDVALEIRRERVTELTFESELRLDDLYRYGQADLVERRYNHQGWAGLWLSDSDVANGFTFEGATYKFNKSQTTNSETTYPISDTNNLNWSLEKAGTGYYLVYNYKLQWDDNKMYCRPIPVSALNVNPNLGQNYGWE